MLREGMVVGIGVVDQKVLDIFLDPPDDNDHSLESR
jgi:hypothetical protein